VIGALTTTDPDAGDTHTYAVSDARFEVVGGQLKLKAGQSLDFEAEPTVNLNVTSTDAGGLSKVQGFTVTVTNVNEAPTAVALSASTVAENAAGAVIGNLTTTDPDAGDTHTYAVSDARFEVVGGQLKLKAGQSLDFEAEPTVNLNVTSTDAGGLSKVQGFTVTVTNVAEGAILPTASNDATDPNNQDNDTLTGVAGSVGANDTLVGTAGANTLSSGAGNDVIYGGAGNDLISGGGDNDVVYGQVGSDTVDGGNNLDAAYGGSGDDVIEGSNGNDVVYGGSGADTTNETGSGDDRIFGGSGGDSINAGAGADTLTGGYGADTLDGGSGNDRFEYFSVLDTNDRILNFAAGDLIDLSGIDANGAGPGNPAFVGLTANSDQLVAFGASWFVSGGNTILIADTDGDAATAEFMITLVGVGHSLSAGGNVLL
jgi:Ca2+-binding RTX toxin-like protein